MEKMKEGAYKQALRYDIHNIVPLYEKLYSRFCTMDCGEKLTVTETKEQISDIVI